jgi:hypothetical protein
MCEFSIFRIIMNIHQVVFWSVHVGNVVDWLTAVQLVATKSAGNDCVFSEFTAIAKTRSRRRRNVVYNFFFFFEMTTSLCFSFALMQSCWRKVDTERYSFRIISKKLKEIYMRVDDNEYIVSCNRPESGDLTIEI